MLGTSETHSVGIWGAGVGAGVPRSTRAQPDVGWLSTSHGAITEMIKHQFQYCPLRPACGCSECRRGPRELTHTAPRLQTIVPQC